MSDLIDPQGVPPPVFPVLFVANGEVELMELESSLTNSIRPRGWLGRKEHYEDSRFLLDSEGRVFAITQTVVSRELGRVFSGVLGLFSSKRVVQLSYTLQLIRSVSVSEASEVIRQSLSNEYIAFLDTHGINRDKLFKRLDSIHSFAELMKSFRLRL